MEDGGFTLVKKGARVGGKQRGRTGTAGKQSDGGGFRYQGVPEAAKAASPAATVAAMQQKLDAAVAQLEGSGLWRGVRAALQATPRVSNIVCLGLGSVGSSASARYQLALALLLRRELLGVPLAGGGGGGGDDDGCGCCGGGGEGGVPAAAPSAAAERAGPLPAPAPAPAPAPPLMDVYDPVLGEGERAMLRARGCGVPERNEEGRRSVAAAEAEGVTLFFMPHCGRQLYANVLEANWAYPNPNPNPNPNPIPLTLTLTLTCSRPTGARSRSAGWPYWATRSPPTRTRSPRRSATARPAGVAAYLPISPCISAAGWCRRIVRGRGRGRGRGLGLPEA